MAEPNLLAGKDCLDFVSSVEAIVRRSCIIDFGIVQNVVANGVVEVSVAVSDTPQNLYYMTCVLANIASSSVTVNVKPNVGDRVLVVYPRIYDENMFTVPDGDEKTEIIVNKQANGYNLMSGIAILLNQFKTASHKNIANFADGTMSLKLAYDKDNDENLIEINTTAQGDISIKNHESEVTIDKQGEITITGKEASISLSKDGDVVITGKKASINMDKDGDITIDSGKKYTIKNSSTDLAEVISKLADEIENLVIVCPNGAGSVNPTSVAKIELWKEQVLGALFNTTPSV